VSKERDVDTAGGIQSIEIGMTILSTLARMRGVQSLSAISREAGMSRTKVYKYLVSFERKGFVEREEGSGHYGLGRSSLQLGIAALGEVDFVKIASAALPRLCKAVRQTVFVSIWGEHGATIIRWEEAGLTVALNVRTGSTVPLLTSATGHLFGAYLPWETVAGFVEREISAGIGTSLGITDIGLAKNLFKQVREKGFGLVAGTYLEGVAAMSFPVFAPESKLAGTISALGLRGLIDVDIGGAIAKELRETASALTERLGGREDPAISLSP
jgi:DNA-binding IclR family transcriptional regulator